MQQVLGKSFRAGKALLLIERGAHLDAVPGD